MHREVLRGKIHRATVTEANLEYEGSLTVDVELLEAAGLSAYERIDVYNITNGNRFSTYLIEGPRHSGVICVNGAAAHLSRSGDKVIITGYGLAAESEVKAHRPRVVLVDEANRIKQVLQESTGSRVS
ncbi:MAG: aspartate 1-decarboxylase [Acidobacteria bacterium]|nr:aspartate 1-decarboxylase [Acidobacteriota bacterium]MCI0568348.1 aspartate 1-decarboxylase [Acidobacteriota bacterium]